MIIENDGFVGIGTTNPFSYLHVKGSAYDATASGINNKPNLSDHVMIVENTYGTRNGFNGWQNGLAIKLHPGLGTTTGPNNTDSADGTMNFITFLTHSYWEEDYWGTSLYYEDGNHRAAGAIEGQVYRDLGRDSDYQWEYAQAQYEYDYNNSVGAFSNIVGMIPIVGGAANAWYSSLNASNEFDRKVKAYTRMRVANMGVCYKSGSADYAEYLERLDVNEEIKPGSIVGLYNGKISKNTSQTNEIMVVSVAPGVLGNMPPENEEHKYEKVAFMGQVPVFVVGKVKAGDFIIASGRNDGLGIAISPDRISLKQINKVVGISWTDANDNRINKINLSIGIGKSELLLVAEKLNEKIITYDNKFNSIDARLASLEKENHPKKTTLKSENIEVENTKFPDMNKEFEVAFRKYLTEYVNLNEKEDKEKYLSVLNDDILWAESFEKVKNEYNLDREYFVTKHNLILNKYDFKK